MESLPPFPYGTFTHDTMPVFTGAPARSASAFSAASAKPTPPLLDGLARRSLAPSPGRGAQLASTAGACGGAFASDVSGPSATERSELRSPTAVSA